jgi:hypothetical protein
MTLKQILFTFCVGLLFTSCDKQTTALYEVTMDATFDLPNNFNTIETYYFPIKNVPTFYSQSAALHSLDTSNVSAVLASRGLITGNFQDVDFDFISRVSIYAVSQKDPNLKREMYYLDLVPLTTDTQLKMLSSSTQLKEILSEELIDLEVRLNFRSFSVSNVKARIEFGYAVF